MLAGHRALVGCFCLFALLLSAFTTRSAPASSWKGIVRDAAGKPVADAAVVLRQSDSPAATKEFTAKTSASGEFLVAGLAAGNYSVTVRVADKQWTAPKAIVLAEGAVLTAGLELSAQGQLLRVTMPAEGATSQGSGGEHLSSEEVSNLPLNERDFSKLLLLAAGTMTDTNGAANFTQQFAVNGQRGVQSVFAIDGADTTDPELGGATFANFNVDAIQEVQSSSGVMPAEIGHGAAGFTNVVSKSGTNQVHGSAFEFVRNAAFDARNFFDHKNDLDPRRIPPFARNEFGVTIGGPVFIPKLYDGRGQTFFFGEYQGFRQVLGTTQVLPVPTAEERQGIDTTTFPGDTLTVPVSPAIMPLLNRYPLPNDPQGPYGARTFATSSKIVTRTDQFSIRVDHKLSDKATLFTRFSLNQIDGPTTNPDQTALEPGFAINFFDHQRNAAVRYTRTISPHLSSSTAFAYIRSTPFFPAENHADPALDFADGSFSGFNTADGSIFGSFGNVYQFKHDMTYLHESHTFKWGVEIRWNKDATIFGQNPNGLYSFGGGTAYSPVLILSASGTHDIHPGDPLPDALTGILTATPYSYTVSAIVGLTPGGNRFDEAAVRREAYNFYFQDTWKATPKLSINYGLRYDLNSRIKEAQHRSSAIQPVDSSGKPTSFLTPSATQVYLYNPQPVYPIDKNGWGPRVSADFAVTKSTTLHAGAAMTTILPNLWQDNFVTGAFPLVFQPLITARADAPVPFQNTITQVTLPTPYSTSGQVLFPNGDSSKVPANTPVDLQRFQNDLAAITRGNEVQLFNTASISPNFRNGYIATYTAGIDHDLHGVKLTASYVGTAGVHLPSVFSPNGYAGADPQFARFTQFNAAGHAIGGFGPEAIMENSSHSSYNALQTGASYTQASVGLNLQASYTFSKSLDDTSAVLGGLPVGPGTILQAPPQDAFNPEAEKGPSTFDVTHVFTLSVFQNLPIERIAFLEAVPKSVTRGWQILNITTLTSGSPFSVFSGIQQTGVGAGGTDRPDQVAMPDFSTARVIREDYFGRGTNNSSFFFIPIGVPGGTGPNSGRFGTLGRDTFRGPAFKDFDIAVIKDTSFGRRGKNELGILEFRAEFFNIFNNVNFGLPTNTVLGSGFGLISKTAGNSRQIQFSLKVIY